MSDIAEEFSPSAKTNKNTKVLSDAGNKTNGVSLRLYFRLFVKYIIKMSLAKIKASK